MLNQLLNTTAVGAVSGTFWGALIGLIFLMPLAGAAIGAASGAIGGALTDVGLDDKWMKETAAAIQPGTAALAPGNAACTSCDPGYFSGSHIAMQFLPDRSFSKSGWSNRLLFVPTRC